MLERESNRALAGNIQIEAIAQLRERRPSGRLFLVGVLMSMVVALILSLEFVSTFGNPALEASIILGAVIFTVVIVLEDAGETEVKLNAGMTGRAEMMP